MSDYRRCFIPGGCYFFTVVTFDRLPVFRDSMNVDLLREAFRKVKVKRPFEIQAMVVLPDHLHAVWQLPDGDADYPNRWREIKKHVSKRVDTATNHRREKQVWQRRYWEHVIRNSDDWRRHLDYVHYNPVKHGLVECARDWPYSSFLRSVERGMYDLAWGCTEPASIRGWTTGYE
ncbi:transposase [Thiohalocapsa marina]|uniref:Transposase n=1 Tax=Thiohalocapsa marina TaxID=424902 RepID=A0A5M8FC11_9GAMM|nr:transposase [Thiohalocapsa marina]KAA6182398.1 transposase [Thiohalocapsa marina]